MAAKISLLPSELDLSLYAGDGVDLAVTLTNSLGEPLVVDGEVTAQIRADRAAPTALADFAADLTYGSNGEVVLSLTGVQTQSLVQADAKQFAGVWDVQWTRGGGEPVTVIQGKITCDADVTR